MHQLGPADPASTPSLLALAPCRSSRGRVMGGSGRVVVRPPYVVAAPRAPLGVPAVPRSPATLAALAPPGRLLRPLRQRLRPSPRLRLRTPATCAPQRPACACCAPCAPSAPQRPLPAPPGCIVAWLGTVSQYSPALPLLHSRNTPQCIAIQLQPS